MIVRQFCARHGRSAATVSSRRLRAYATIDQTPGQSTPSVRDDKSIQQIPGHPSDPTSILDTSPYAPTPATRAVEKSIRSLTAETRSIQASINSHISARILSMPDDPPSHGDSSHTTLQPTESLRSPSLGPNLPPPPYSNLSALYRDRNIVKRAQKQGTDVDSIYDPLTILRKPPSSADLTLPMLLANQTHLGHHTSLWHPGNSSYIFGIRDSIHIIGLDVTFAHLRRAAKIVTEIARRGGIILIIGTRDGQEDIVVSTARRAQAYHIFNRWVPGSLTNGQQIYAKCALKVVDLLDRPLPQYDQQLATGQAPVLKPDLVICLNMLENEVCLHECALNGIPTIGVVDTDCNSTRVTYPIPANDDSLRSIALIAGVLGRAGEEGQMLRLEAARKGKLTYSPAQAEKTLKVLEELSSLDVQDREQGEGLEK